MERKYVFISYSSQNQAIANAICHIMEEYGIPCWIAPRDILPGKTWAGNIVQAIRDCALVVLVYSKDSNISEQVANEIDKAFNFGRTIIPFIVDSTPMNDDFDYYLSRKHWLVAYPDYQEKLMPLVTAVANNLGMSIFNHESSEKSNNEQDEDENIIEDLDAVRKRITVKGVSFEMILVEAGSFIMGATPEQTEDAYEDEFPSHRVELTDNFYMAEYPVTNRLWKAVTGDKLSAFDGDDAPAENMSWNECKDFIAKLNKLTGLCFSLPTEAQWEFAARGGNSSHGYKYSGSHAIYDTVWYEDNSDGTTKPVGQKPSNELGLYDMSGNVWEWCEDDYVDYKDMAATNPFGKVHGNPQKVLRGGSWCSCESYCRVSSRSYASPDGRAINSGLRLILNVNLY